MRPSDYVEKLIGPIPESSLPRDQWQANFLESATRNLVHRKGEQWVKENRKFLLAQLSYIWSL